MDEEDEVDFELVSGEVLDSTVIISAGV